MLSPGNSRDSPIAIGDEQECLVWFRTRTRASVRPDPLEPVYIAAGEDRTLAAQLKLKQEQQTQFEAELILMRFGSAHAGTCCYRCGTGVWLDCARFDASAPRLSCAPCCVANALRPSESTPRPRSHTSSWHNDATDTRIRSCVSNTFCSAGIQWPGGEDSLLALNSESALCTGAQTEFEFGGRVLSCESSEAELAASGIEDAYASLVTARAILIADIIWIAAAVAQSPPPLDTVPHVWRMKAYTDPNNTELKQYSLHHQGFCMELANEEVREFNCGVGGEIVAITSAYYGDVRGFCGEYSQGTCSVDVKARLERGERMCVGNMTCPINAS
eukprot:568172-Rhodomonas_salina.1